VYNVYVESIEGNLCISSCNCPSNVSVVMTNLLLTQSTISQKIFCSEKMENTHTIERGEKTRVVL